MDLRQLRSLVAVAEERNFTRAAERLCLAQPALSQHIRRLEQELGVTLLDRTTRHVAPTQAGELLLRRARLILAEVAAAREDIDELRGLRRGRLTVGVTPTPGAFDLADVLASFTTEFPAIELVVREALSTDLCSDVRGDRVDVAFVTGLEGDLLRGLTCEPVSRERLVTIVPREHRLAGRGSMCLSDLRGERFITFGPGATIRERLETAARDAGFTLFSPFEVSDVLRVKALVKAGLGVAVLPLTDATRPGPAVVPVGLDAPEFTHELLLATRSERRHGPVAKAFIDLVRDRAAMTPASIEPAAVEAQHASHRLQ